MQLQNVNLANTIFVGIDAHQGEHTALAITHFEEEKGRLQFQNTKEGRQQFIKWLTGVKDPQQQLIVGIEGGGNSRHALVSRL